MGEGAEKFIFATFLGYGILFMFFSASNGYIFGLETSNAFASLEPTAPATGGITDFLVGSFEVVLTFFGILFLVPLSGLWFMLPINWAILGANIYIFFKLLRGGG